MRVDRTSRTTALLLLAGVCAVSLGVIGSDVAVSAQAPPRYKFDAEWPKVPLPNKWWMGGVTGLDVDADDNVWVLNRPADLDETENYATLNPPTAECCVKPPAVIAFNRQGDVIASFDAPQGHGMAVDAAGNVWIGSDRIRKYTREGRQVGEIARVSDRQPGGNATPDALAAFRGKYKPDNPLIIGGLEELRADDQRRELYAIDSYLGGRVLVYDMDTLQFKRGWGAYGKPLAQISTAPSRFVKDAPPPKDFVGHVTLNVSRDGLVYAADRQGNRIQVYTRDGTFQKEFFIATSTLDRGSAGGVAFSADRQQRHLFISDIQNNTIWILDRDDGKVLGRIGSPGNNGGQFHGLHMIATDSRGNIYTGEVQAGERVQRFVPLS
jgi:sugar lactone lactonase YvrE